MEKLIQLLQSVGEQMGAFAWVVLGFLFLIGIATGMLVLGWIHGGGMAPETRQRFFTEQREITLWLRDK